MKNLHYHFIISALLLVSVHSVFAMSDSLIAGVTGVGNAMNHSYNEHMVGSTSQSNDDPHRPNDPVNDIDMKLEKDEFRQVFLAKRTDLWGGILLRKLRVIKSHGVEWIERVEIMVEELLQKLQTNAIPQSQRNSLDPLKNHVRVLDGVNQYTTRVKKMAELYKELNSSPQEESAQESVAGSATSLSSSKPAAPPPLPLVPLHKKSGTAAATKNMLDQIKDPNVRLLNSVSAASKASISNPNPKPEASLFGSLAAQVANAAAKKTAAKKATAEKAKKPKGDPVSGASQSNPHPDASAQTSGEGSKVTQGGERSIVPKKPVLIGSAAVNANLTKKEKEKLKQRMAEAAAKDSGANALTRQSSSQSNPSETSSTTEPQAKNAKRTKKPKRSDPSVSSFTDKRKMFEPPSPSGQGASGDRPDNTRIRRRNRRPNRAKGVQASTTGKDSTNTTSQSFHSTDKGRKKASGGSGSSRRRGSNNPSRGPLPASPTESSSSTASTGSAQPTDSSGNEQIGQQVAHAMVTDNATLSSSQSDVNNAQSSTTSTSSSKGLNVGADGDLHSSATEDKSANLIDTKSSGPATTIPNTDRKDQPDDSVAQAAASISGGHKKASTDEVQDENGVINVDGTANGEGSSNHSSAQPTTDGGADNPQAQPPQVNNNRPRPRANSMPLGRKPDWKYIPPKQKKTDPPKPTPNPVDKSKKGSFVKNLVLGSLAGGLIYWVYTTYYTDTDSDDEATKTA